MVIEVLIPKSLHISVKNSASNCTPRSVISFSGNPNHEKTSLMKISAVRSAVRPFLVQGDNIIPLLRPWSTVTIIESKPSSVRGRSVIKSIPNEPKRRCDPLGMG